ncbi:MAG TPA: amino acid adenylation domain-containing protein [Herpetosiphonaceae bacterium]
MLVDWNRSEAEYPRAAAVHALIEAQAARTPHTQAIVFEGASLTYAALNARANQLAHYLRAQGVGPDVLVALCVERSLEMIVGILAILKAGGAYVPLDPNYPAERLAYMLSHSRAPVILTQAALVERLHHAQGAPGTRHPAQVFCLDADWHTLAQQPTTNPPRTALPEHLAYIIFTSGSTGRPKGVMVTQRGLINLVYGLRAYFTDPAVQITGLITSISFDISVNQIFPTLFFGRTLHIIPDPVKFDSRALLCYLDAHAIHLLDAVPSYIQAVLNEVAPQQPPNALRYLLIGGEKLEQRLLDAVFGQLGPQVEIVNIYGLTEISDINLLGGIRASDLGQPITVGRPLQNNRIYILDRSYQPQPIGIAGEVCVSGASVSRGYLYRPDLTAERFVPCPFEDGALMVRTGDLGRWQPDGTVEILGRIDHQVKIRGFRIEPGEIEAVLRQHEAVREAVVIVRDVGQDDARLVAYVVDQRTTEERAKEPLSAELRTYARERLPDYMVPSAFVLLDALPLTPNGKLDRNALPAPEGRGSDTAASYTAPRSRAEEMLSALWSAVLKVERVGIHDNFFALGGHSLLATQVVSRMRQQTGQDLPLRLLFEAPTIAEFAAYLPAPDDQPRETEAEPETVPSVGRGAAPIPLSFAQQRLWFFEQLQPGSTTYSIPSGVRIRGAIDPVALQRSLSTVVQRHEILRTTFAYDPSAPTPVPYQQIAPPSELELPTVVLPRLTSEEAIRQIVQAEMAQPFDLQQGPLLRATLFRVAPDDHILALVIHHGIFDGWSNSIFLRELIALYKGFVAGQPVELPPLRLQYADYALWQRQWLQSTVRDEQLRYWRRQLADAPPLELPTDYPRPPVVTYYGGIVKVQVPAALTQPLHRLSQRLNSTLFMTLLAAFQALRYRYSGQSDLVVGTPIAGRTRPEFEEVIGPFANTLVLRTDLGGAPSFEELVERVRGVCLDAYAHQDVPFEMLVEELQPERDLSIHPLFQVLFAFQNTPSTALVLPGLSFQAIPPDLHGAKVDLLVTFSESAGRINGIFSYRTDLFAATTIEKLAQHYLILLQAALADPHQSIATLPLLMDMERWRLLFEWNTPGQDTPQEAAIHELIAAQIARTPDAIALIDGEHAITYRELHDRVNQLAHQLRAQGVGGRSQGEVRVGVCLPRSLDLIVALLAVLEAGGAYVPLDPTYPQARLQFIIDDAAIAVLVTQERLTATLSPYDGSLVCLDRDSAQIAQRPTSRPGVAVLPDTIAYIIYTSGSTGLPKGVMISHRALVSYITAAQQRYALTPADRMLQFAAITFDASAEEIYTSLTSGATLVLRSDEMLSSPETFFRLCDAWRITVLSLPTAFWHLLAEALADAELAVPAALRLVIIGGERAAPARVAQWQDRLHAEGARRCTLLNTYGPTETTIVATAYPVPPHVEAAAGEIPIGRPLANLRAYVLDRQMEPVPIGGRGELFLGGPQLARGYLNRPALTAERFVPDPFSPAPGGRLYRTGDLARYLPSGDLDYLGRIDQQIKLRGFRVEPGEIEAVLRQHEAVREAVVIVRDVGQGDARLVAYVVDQRTTEERAKEPLSAELRSYARERLPDYMVPRAFVLLEAFPLTPSGKVDRNALPAPNPIHTDEGGSFVAPRTPLEDLIAGVWATVFGVERVSIHDNFFTLGGHSLLATQVITRVRHLTGREVPLRLLFEAPTIAEFADQISVHSAAVDVPLVAVPRAAAPPLSFAQQRLWYLEQLQPGTSMYSIPVAIRLTGPLDPGALRQSLAAIVERHEVLRTTFVYDPLADVPDPQQRVAPPSDFSLPGVVLPPDADDATIRQVVQAEVDQPFDLARGPLFRATLFQQRHDVHILVLVLHHSIFDGWSTGVLVRELTTLYRAIVDNRPSPLPALPLQYADYTVWQRAWLAQGAPRSVLEQQLDYWRRQLADVAPLDLPIDHPRPPIASYHGGHHLFHLPAALTSELHRLSQTLGSTLFMTLLAAFQTLLYRYSGQTDVVVGTPVAGRVRPELEGLIGFFTNTLVLRADLSGNPSFADVVARTRATCLDAYAHQDVPFEVVVEQVHPTRDLSRHPLFQVMFILQNIPQAAIDLSGLTVEPVAVESHTAKFDLVMVFGETPDGLQGAVEYATDLFDATTIARLVDHYQTLLAGMIADPARSIASLPLLTQAERRQIVVDWNHTPLEVRPDLLVHQLVEAQAARTPDALAVVFGDASLTYAAFDRRANQLAHLLRQHGVGPDACVALALDRSLDLAVAVLAVLKAGGAYLPLDPAYPQERLRFMLADANAPVLLTHTALVDQLPSTAAHVLTIDTLVGLDRYPVLPLTVAMAREHLAYVLYTSGSTGTPKAVAMPHAALVNLLTWQRQSTTVEPTATTLQFAALSFDVSFQEMFTTWTSGGTLRLITESERRDLSALAALLATGSVQRVFLPFIALQHLAEVAVQQQHSLHGVREIVTAGEQLQITSAIMQVYAQIPGATLHNHYGPTETHAATAHILSGDPTLWPTLPPIGRPIGNTRIYLLDARGEPVPIGVAGELYIGGAQLARGYLHRPAVTAERFLPDPFAQQPGARMYRTGDRARYRADGNIEYLGRSDQQVKVRGFRVEVGEIEAALRQHPAVGDAVVTVREDTSPAGGHPQKRLVAYIVAEHRNKAHRNLEPGTWNLELRAFLGSRLPEHMIPSAFVLLDALPLTPSGKVNRRALPAPDPSAFASDTSLVGPRDYWEWWLAQLWADLLHLPTVGVHDDFFALGGHSLLAVRVMAEIRQRLGRTLPLATLLQAPTIAQVAVHLRQSGSEMPWSPLVPLQPRGSRRPFFCVHPGGGTVFCYADLARLLGSDQPFYGLQARGLEAGQTPHQTIADLAAEYVTAIRTVQPHGPYLLGGWSFGGSVAFEMACRLRDQGEDVSLLALIDSFAPAPGQAPPDAATLAAAFARDLGGMFGKALEITPADLAPLPVAERLAYVLAQAQRQQALPPDIDRDQFQRLADVFYANLAMQHAATLRPTAVPVALLEVDREAQAGHASVLAEGWRVLTPIVERQVVAGTHYTLLRPPHVQFVADWLGKLLDAAQADS